MSYIGKQPVVGNFQKCDAISVVNGQAAYTLNGGGAAVTPENANHMLVSLNGVLQAPGDSFTISGSTLTFASNLATGDVIDFVIILGDVLDLGTPSDNSISTAKLVANSVTAAKLNNDIISGLTALGATPADTDELLVSDAGTIKRVDFSHIKSEPTTVKLSESNITSATSEVNFDGLFSSTYRNYRVVIDDLTMSAEPIFRMRINTSCSEETGSNYRSGQINVLASSSGGSADASRKWNQDHFEMINYEVDSEAGNVSAFIIDILSPLNTATYPYFMSRHFVLHANRANLISGTGSFFFNTAQAITGIRFKGASGTISTGNFILYGIKD